MWPFMYKESDWMLINDNLHRGVNRTTQLIQMDQVFTTQCARVSLYCSYFEDKVWWRARSHCGPEDPIMVRVDQRLVQIQNQNFPLYCIWFTGQ